jgi:hypothetical protein
LVNRSPFVLPQFAERASQGKSEAMFATSVEESPKERDTARARVAALLSRVFSLAASHHRKRRLHLCETLSLGEKRFLAVVEYDQQKFLLAGTPVNISLLQRLGDGAEKTDQSIRSESGRRPEPSPAPGAQSGMESNSR